MNNVVWRERERERGERFDNLKLILIFLGIFLLNFISTSTIVCQSGIDNTSFYSLDLNRSSSTFSYLVSYFPFDSNFSDDIFDIANKSRTAVKYGGILRTSNGRYGGAYEFDGTNDFLTYSSISFADSSSWSASYWLNWKGPSVSTLTFLAGKNASTTHHLLIRYGGNNRFGFRLANATYELFSENTLNSAYQSGWSMLTVTINGSNKNVSLYLNGTYIESKILSNSSMIFSSLGGVSTFYFNGTIDEAMIFNKTLSSSEISEIYNSQSYKYQNSSNCYIERNLSSGAYNATIYSTYLTPSDSSINLSFVSFEGDNEVNSSVQAISGLNNFSISSTISKIILNATFYSGAYSFFGPLINSMRVIVYYLPEVNISGVENQSSYLTTEEIPFFCEAKSNSSLNYVSLIVDDGSTTTTRNFTKGAFDEEGVNSTYVVTFNGQSPIESNMLRATTSDGYTDPAKNTTLMFDNAYVYFQLDRHPSFSNPIWFQIELNDTYELNRFHQYTYSVDTFRCTDYDIYVGLDNYTWTNVISKRNVSASEYDDSFTPTNAKWLKLFCYNRSCESCGSAYYATWSEFKIYGKNLSTIKDAYSYKNFSMLSSTLSSNSTKNLTAYCSFSDALGYSLNSSILNISISSKPNVTYLDVSPNPANVSSYVYATCNFSNLGEAKSGADVAISYKLNSSTEWINLTADYVSPYLIYSFGDSIVSSNLFQSRLDGLMGSNSSATNSSNTSQKLYNFGVGGNTCPEALANFNAYSVNGTTAIILCGINGYAQESNKIYMEQIQGNATARNISLIWLSVLTATNYSLNVDSETPERIYELNEWLRTNLTSRYNSIYVDAHTAIYNGTYGFCEPSLCNADGLHPSSDGYTIIGREIWEQAFQYKIFDAYQANLSIPSSYSNNAQVDFRCIVGNSLFNSDSYYNYSFTVLNSAVSSVADSVDEDSGTSSGIYKPSENSLEKGYSVNVIENQKVQIPVGDSNKNIEIKSINQSSGEVVVSVDGNDYLISENSSGKIDLDSDGFYDVEISSNGISNGIAKLEFILIHEEIPSENQKGQEKNIIEQIPEIVKKLDWKFYVSVGIVLILIFVWFSLKVKKKKRYKKYGY